MFTKIIYSEKLWLIVLSALIGALIIVPSFYFRYFDEGYRGLDFFSSDNENFYLAQVQEIYDGHWSFGNALLAEGKSGPYVLPPLPAMIIAFLGKLLDLSARDINLLTKFLLPFLLTILVYYFFANISERKDVALVMAAFVMLIQATWALLNPTSWPTIFLSGKFPGTDPNFLAYARPINPQISSFFFFGYLLCVWKFLFGQQSFKRERLWGTLSAIILGLSFYVYFFTYSFLGIFNAVLFLWFWYKKEWRQLKKIAIISIGSLLMATPYFINLFATIRSPFYTDLAHRLGAIDTHRFIFSRVWWGVFLLFILLYRKFDYRKIFILAFLTSAFLVTNQQVLTGKIFPDPRHYHWYYIAPVGGAILIYLFFLYFEKIAKAPISKIATAVCLMLFLYAGFLYQKDSYLRNKESMVYFQRYAQVIDWLDKNITEESSVFANNDISIFIPAYTRHNVLAGENWDAFLISQERIKHNFYISLFLNGVTKDTAKDYFYSHRERVAASIFGQYYRLKNGCYGCFSDEIFIPLISEYQNFLEEDFVSQLKKYQVDYVIWDKTTDPSWGTDRFFSEKIYNGDNILIYKT